MIENILRVLNDLKRRVEALERVEKLYVPAYDDYVVQIGQSKLPASGAPNVVAWRGCEVLEFSKSATNTMYFIAQIPHSYKEGTTIEFHIHVAYPAALAGDSKWRLTHSWANIGAPFPGETTLTAVAASPVTLNDHQVIEVASTITGTGFEISSILLCSISRLGADVQDTYDGVIYLVGADFHILRDALGSRQEYVK